MADSRRKRGPGAGGENQRPIQPGIEIICEDNPYFVKGIIQQSAGVVGSRYHSLASAMYEGIVALGTGWSHKYEALYSAFEFPEGLIDLNISTDELHSKLNYILDSRRREHIQAVLREKAQEQQLSSVEMFHEIKQVIGLT